MQDPGDTQESQILTVEQLVEGAIAVVVVAGVFIVLLSVLAIVAGRQRKLNPLAACRRAFNRWTTRPDTEDG